MPPKPDAPANELSPARIREQQEWPMRTIGSRVIDDFVTERERQDAKHPGTVDFPDGTGVIYSYMAYNARLMCDVAASQGTCTWKNVLEEEVCEAYAESDHAKLRAELVQVMAVAGRWIETIDSRVELTDDEYAVSVVTRRPCPDPGAEGYCAHVKCRGLCSRGQ